jgi:HK97 family phage prohead protease
MTGALLHKQVDAAATTTDLGEFEALAAIFDTTDRVGDVIAKGAFAKTIAAWVGSGRRVPLHWNHSGEASDVIGSIDPASMRETSEGLRVKGRLDLEGSETAREAWRSVKADTIGVSFGYLTVKESKRGKVNVLEELDLYEISLTPAPAHPDARILSTKSVGENPLPSDEELREKMVELGVRGARRKSSGDPIKVASFEV